MRKTLTALGFIGLAFTVAACDTDAERAVGGAAAGGVIAGTTGGSVATGAIIGGAAGAFCDDVGVCD
ncbi:hypothetical protein [Litoreibacter roseus]|uniref:Uncharacterized protein n=1 Tax=Litoreibacter roseus TaxID=2601869 RepID=A0A6N6JHU8_9RHOB|nr:hypothetical protein [Litoreibacter roseus]GFE65684.1 hypothetical protein KIN_27580 [Litoreibacter roseus]